MPDFVIIMVYKATNTSEPKFQYFIWQEDQANCIFFPDKSKLYLVLLALFRFWILI